MFKDTGHIFHTISKLIADSGNKNNIFENIVNALKSSLDVDVCSIYIYNKQEEILTLEATDGLNPNAVGKIFLTKGQGLTGLCFEQNKNINIVNPERHQKFVKFDNASEEHYKLFFATPISFKGEKIGVLVIQRKEPKHLSKLIVDNLTAISSQLANVIVDSKTTTQLHNQNKSSKKRNKDNNISLQGQGANSGIGLGYAFLCNFENAFDQIFYKKCKDPEDEKKVLEIAINITKKRTIALEEKALQKISEADASIFYSHLLFLDDKILLEKLNDKITVSKLVAEYAVKEIFDEYTRIFKNMDANIFKEKIFDLKDVLLRLVEVILSLKKSKINIDKFSEASTQKTIIFTKEILPSDLMRLPADNVVGIVSERGGIADHVAILAKALGIPAIRGVKNLFSYVNNGDEVIIDGFSNFVHIRPEGELKEKFVDILAESVKHNREDIEYPVLKTKDNVDISIKANISLVNEASSLKHYGADGIGLYRSEFLYMLRDHQPTEQEQYNVFKKLFDIVPCDMDVVFRVLDVGSDKEIGYLNIPEENNPALGQRGLKLLLNNKDLLKPHLRAILRAANKRSLKIMFPTVCSSDELDEINNILYEVESDLQFENIDYSENYKIGSMIEVPSIIYDLDNLAAKVDFMSIGTNDLIQYLFAVDRTNEFVFTKDYHYSPILLRVLKQIGESAKNHNKPVSVCGEMASDKNAIPLLIGAGIFELSMPARYIPERRDFISNLDCQKCTKLLDEAVKLRSIAEVKTLLEEFNSII